MGGLFFSAPLEHARRYASPGDHQQWHRMEFVSDLNSAGGTLAPLRALIGRCEFWKCEGFYEGKRRLRAARQTRAFCDISGNLGLHANAWWGWSDLRPEGL
jgi:hypothetical protein